MVDAVGTTEDTYDHVGQLLIPAGPFGTDAITNPYVNRLHPSLVLQQPTDLWTKEFM